jgi:hypothetical protein
VGVDHPLGLVQLRTVVGDELATGLGPAAPEALEGGPVRHQVPEPFLQAEGGFHDELGQVMRQVGATGSGGIVDPWNRPCLGSSARHEHRRPSSALENTTFMRPS